MPRREKSRETARETARETTGSEVGSSEAAHDRARPRVRAILRGLFNVYSLGLGLLWAWVYCAYQTPALFGELTGFDINADPSWIVAASAVTAALVLLGIALRRRDLSRMPSACLAAGALVAVGGLLCAFVPSLPVALAGAGRLAGGVAIGLGYAWLCIAWGGALSRCDDELAEASIPASAVATVGCSLLFPLLQGVTGTLATTLIPLASAVLLSRANTLRESPVDVNGNTPVVVGPAATVCPNAIAGTRLLGPVACSFVLLCVTYFAVTCSSATFGPDSLSSGAVTAASVIGVLSGVALAFGMLEFSMRIDFRSIFRWVTPMVVIACALTTLDGRVTAFFSLMLQSCVDECTQALTFIFFVNLGRRGLLPVSLGIGLGQGAVQLGTLAGNLTASMALTGPFEGPAVPLGLILLAIVAITVASSLVDTIDAPFSTRPGGGAAAVGGGAGGIGGELPGATGPRNTRAERIARLAETYGLSPRECEVTALLAQGYSQPYIRDQLVLSKSTVATHVRHIYAKLDIHTRQELIDLVNEGSE